MRPISQKNRKIINESLFYKRCIRSSDECSGRITIEHAFIYAKRQIDELWSLLPLCWFHHLGEGLDKRFNQWFAVNRATDLELLKYPKKDWAQIKRHLNKTYGENID